MTSEKKYPFVESLVYKAAHSDAHVYPDDLRCEGTLGGFTYELAQDRVTFRPTSPFHTEADARAVLDPLVEGWNLDALLRHGPDAFALHFERAVLVQEPPKGSGLFVQLQGVASVAFVGRAVALLKHSKYPEPPSDMEGNELTAALADRYRTVFQNRDTILLHGYAFLSRLEYEYGSRSDVAAALNVDDDVIGTIGRLTSERGTAFTARKFKRGKTPVPLTATENDWLLQTLGELLRRVAQEAAGPVPAENLTRLP